MVTKKPKRLGLGLEALLGPQAKEPLASDALAGAPSTLKLSQLQPGKYQPRTRMDEGSLYELAESIKGQGVMQPVLVRPVAGEGHGDALIRARESKGKFIPAGDGGYRIDIFLRADSFGARADEQLSLLVDSSGSAFIESRLPGVPPRRLDSGRCSAAAGV